MANLAPNIIEDLFGTKVFTVMLTLRDSTNTTTLTTEAIIINSNNGGAVVANNNTSEIMIVGTQAQCNTAMQNTKFRPSADYETSIGIKYSQSDDNGTGAPGSNPYTSFMNLGISTTHNEFSIVSAITYSTNTTATWNMGAITDLRPDNIDANIQYTLDILTDNFSGNDTSFTGWQSVTHQRIPAENGVHPNFLAGMFSDTGTVFMTWRQNDILIYEKSLAGVWEWKFTIDVIATTWNAAISGDGNTIAVGSNTLNDQGEVRMYHRFNGTSWSGVQTVTEDIPADNHRFGWKVGLSYDGAHCIIGNLYLDQGIPVSDTNNLHYFTRTNDVWSFAQKFQATGAQPDDDFSSYFAINSTAEHLVVGAQKHDEVLNSENEEGKCYYFSRVGSVWTEQQAISKAIPAISDRFGSEISMSLDGLRMLISQTGSIFTGDNEVVYSYLRTGNSWALAQTITSPSANFAGFGVFTEFSADGLTAILNSAYTMETFISTDANEDAVWVVGAAYHEYINTIQGDGLSVYGMGDLAIFITSTNGVSEFRLVGTKAACNLELASVEFIPLTGYNLPFTITYTQNQDTDNINQGSTTINITNI